MLDEPENETVVLENLEKLAKDGNNPEGKHHHHLREVECKAGEKVIVMTPFLIGQEKVFDRTERYVRTADVDELGRAIFRMETA